jgi:hypothetical protein
MRRRLRFRLRTLLFLPVLFAACWWWITWPKRTLRALDSRIAAGQMDAARAMIVFEPDYRMTAQAVAHQLRGQPHTRLAKRTLRDLLLARQTYDLAPGGVMCWVQNGSKFEHRVCGSVTVERGVIKYQWGCTMQEWDAQRMGVGLSSKHDFR